ncbi:MAG: hypothetical protein CMH57_03900 [Myxococcales bacterium]|nr:hypothetical protein [Myxococcales bacterium]
MTSEQPQPPPQEDASTEVSPRRRAAEVAAVFVVSLVLTRLFSDLAQISTLIAEQLFALVSAVFILLPYAVLTRRPGHIDDTLDRHALTWDGWPRALGYAALLTLLTAAPFFAGYHAWRTAVLGHEFTFDVDHYWHLPSTLEGRPHLEERPDDPEILIWSEGRVLHTRWSAGRHRGDRAHNLTLELRVDDGLIHPLTGVAWSDDPEVRRDSTPKPAITLRSNSNAPRAASFVLEDATRLQVRALLNEQPATARLLRLGPSLAPVDDGVGDFDAATQTLDLDRSLWWLPLIILMQLLLIALPEEFFYRGYTQTSLDGLTGERRWAIPGTPLHLSPAIVLTSLMFGVGHVIINFNPSRMAVFFPSLLFGWLRDRTGTIVSCVVYHAACNLMVELAAQHYI